MLRYLKQQKVRQTAIWGLFLSIVVLTIPLVCSAYTTFFTEGFETYNLGALNGQQSWVSTYAQIGNNLSPYFYPIKEGEKSMFGYANSTTYKNFDNNSEGILSIWFYLPVENFDASTIILKRSNGDYVAGLWFYDCIIWPEGEEQSYCKVKDTFGEEYLFDVDRGVWQNIQLRWKDSKWQYNLNGAGWSGERNFENTDFDYVNQFSIYGPFYFDDFSGEYVPPTERVFGVSPASETEITNLADTFIFGWEELDDWDTLSVLFQNENTGIFTEAEELLITTSPSGQESFYFSDFNFDRNGKYNFYAVATRTVLEVLEGMYLTGRYSYEWSDDLVSPEFWYTINIGGFTPIFEMTDFSTWYGSVSKFATPTDMFVSIAGFFEPTFNKIGEFGNRIKDYFNLSEVYSQGYEIGKTIPYFSYFVGQISLFLGGFPILKWVFVVILLLVGIFIFRLVLKFIPGLG